MTRTLRIAFALLALAGLAGCSMNQLVVSRVGDAIAQGGTTFASDDDPALVKAAAPFSLKLMESLLVQDPRHEGLLLAASRGFTQYAYAFVQQEADEEQSRDARAANAMRSRARALYHRARGYGLRALAVSHPNFREELRIDPRAALDRLGRGDAERLYWTTVAWAAEISLSLESMDSIAELRYVDHMIERLRTLDPDMERGALHAFLVTYEMGRPGARDAEARALEHFVAAVRLTEGKAASPYVAFAENVCVARQDRGQFVAHLEKALAIDPAERAEWQLENRVMQRRARWLLGRTDELFLE